MELNDIIKPINSELAAVKKRYARELKVSSEPLRGIGRYISGTRGKFFRPILVLLSAKSGNNGNLDKAISVGVAVELIHAASLIHDDIIDDATLRRKQKTVNTRWGNAVSVIAGDYLLAKAFGIVSKLDEPRVLSTFAKTASRMCEGEVVQLFNAYNFEMTSEQYLEIISRKSAYLISDCCAVGGILGDLSDKEIRSLASYGLNLGIAFQIADDCLDLTGNECDLGKSICQDMDEGKLTLPMIMLLKNSSRKNRAKIVELITLGGNTAHRLLKEEALNSGAILRSMRIASHYARLSKEKLSLPKGVLRKSFFDLADYVLKRKH